ncbi:MAG: hypothetical protein UT65_C0008G0013 [Parcubacteria group bacterium GW2011_GWF2_39_8b]|uniref:DUF4258 domain-containing protein n=3 Tax=Candidatus Zambryskiibacteriota TaxID=1817925 RepID=A0A1G2T8X6_9BACT|nr:MAG: hypothetical protein UT65_C0008G0013 [Parcubacteria group bacterium GW2011_GWF2_39_8b]KKR45728.1 MAG: hypothetical protein UT81_C0007G0010 [Parcubacteria group bacterium GW2011_GWA2_40_14]OHA93720.1 MAG: hypothetical protein A2W58_00690 [Candidatus Zambryskibacteria bacterium RIFCSPHIGHO2_02_38_10.5]OHA95728.1 MAG: hypothetical protein A3C63_00625 [Candidatus Zambryskibacteria bacterium RIFCSPHIGHO2_02_FULL_39_82]OHA97845.1 MAG: hypothetical protein A3E32_02605 [Candidatus Zambryskibact
MIRFSKHALLKLEQRKIGKNFVFATLEKPDYTTGSLGGRAVVFKKFKTLYMKVIFRRKSDITIVITQYWVKKIQI